MHGLLRAVFEQTGASVLLVTHDPFDAARLADRAIVLEGRPAAIERDIVFAAARGERDEGVVRDYVGMIGG
jgi:ABC-type nitrate/sulfonate/bicarbonate transport system ATPase subunit